MSVRSDRLKKLEAELQDLEQWLKLGLVPKKDIPKHQTEIEAVRAKIDEESDKLKFLKESGELEEYVTPRRQPARSQFTEMPTLPDIDMNEDSTTETTEAETDSVFDTSYGEDKTDEEDQPTEEYSEDDDPFSDKNRWKRGMLRPDEDEW